jgi:dTDP-4-dehydrorhamnose 3,5-epimerase-like enzyme
VFFLKSSSNIIKRGGHAHKQCNQFLISIKGEIKIFIKDREGGTVDIKLNSMDNCFIPAGLWIEIIMSSDSILMVLCDAPYSEDDYIRQWETYVLNKGH